MCARVGKAQGGVACEMGCCEVGTSEGAGDNILLTFASMTAVSVMFSLSRRPMTEADRAQVMR